MSSLERFKRFSWRVYPRLPQTWQSDSKADVEMAEFMNGGHGFTAFRVMSTCSLWIPPISRCEKVHAPGHAENQIPKAGIHQLEANCAVFVESTLQLLHFA